MARLNCRNCDSAATASDRFCPWCGAPDRLSDETGISSSAGDAGGPAPGPSDPADEELRKLRAAVNSMTDELARLSLRLSVLEREGGSSGASQQAQPSAPPSPPPPVAVPSALRPPSPEHESAPAPSSSAAATPAIPSQVGQADAALGREAAQPPGAGRRRQRRLRRVAVAGLSPCRRWTSRNGTGSGCWGELTGPHRHRGTDIRHGVLHQPGH